MDKNQKIALTLLNRHRQRHVRYIRERIYWIHSYITNRKDMGDFYTVFEDLREHEGRFFVYFGTKSFDELHDRLKNTSRRRNTFMREWHRTYANVSCCNSKVSKYIIKNKNTVYVWTVSDNTTHYWYATELWTVWTCTDATRTRHGRDNVWNLPYNSEPSKNPVHGNRVCVCVKRPLGWRRDGLLGYAAGTSTGGKLRTFLTRVHETATPVTKRPRAVSATKSSSVAARDRHDGPPTATR